jgi:hypothetical protein
LCGARVLSKRAGAAPVTNFNAATFGRILTQEGDPRIMQFGIKYAF